MCNNGQIENGEYEVIGETHSQLLENNHHGTDEMILKIYGYRSDRLRQMLFQTVSIILLGIPFLIMNWSPKYKLLKYKKSSLKDADLIYITDKEDTYHMERVLEIELDLPNYKDKLVRYFIFQHARYIWLVDQCMFVNVQTMNEKLTIAQLLENTCGINKRQQNELAKLYGPNSIEVEVKSYWTLFVNEVFNPFYIFQVFSIILWSLDHYYQYAACVFILSTISICTSLYQTKKLSLTLHDLVESSSGGSVSVVRGKSEIVTDASRLVPGDVLTLPRASFRMPCDALLLTGTCIVNESMLTGESVPVMKSPPNLSNEKYSTETHKRHTLYAGTQVIQTRFYGNNQVLAKVVRTGFYTSRGELVKSILFPKPIGFQFYKDAVKFVICLFFIATIGMAYCIWIYIQRESPLDKILLRTLDIITIVVPPALPAAMTAGTIYSQQRLRKHKIFCISPLKINVCGKLNVVCFDKTGTLTEDGLDLYGILPMHKEDFGITASVKTLSQSEPLLQAMASCHSLTSVDGQLTGDPLDLKMFEATGWILEEPGPENTRYDNLAPAVVKPANTNESVLQDLDDFELITAQIPYEIGILRRFHFSSTQQSMGVVARILGQPNMVYYVKGAPEKVAGMCKPDSLPQNFHSVLNEYTSNGFRVIGLAYKNMDRRVKYVDAQRMKREQIECDLVFLGLLLMQNSLKPETTSIIGDLHQAKIRQIMITGDNLMTAASVGRVCGMVKPQERLVVVTCSPPSIGDSRPSLTLSALPSSTVNTTTAHTVLALDGKTWTLIRQHYPDLIPTILSKGTIFGRFGPDQKTSLVVALQGCGWVVGMCGDGANDCGALKAAHIGVSLSQAEASVAAPFTSREENITCMRQLVLEGRCALSTSFAIFKYMALYSFIQFISVLILYNSCSILGDMQFLYIDLVLTTLLALSLGRSGPGQKLTSRSPAARLAAFHTVLPLFLQVTLCLGVQLAASRLLQEQPWFTPQACSAEVEEVLCWENTVIFIVSAFQYLTLAAVYAKGEPFREPFTSNYAMLCTLTTMTVFVLWLWLYPWNVAAQFMEVQAMVGDFTTPENKFRLYLLLLPMLHLVISIAIEAFMSDTSKFRQCVHGISVWKRNKRKDYSVAKDDIEASHWLEAIKCENIAC